MKAESEVFKDLYGSLKWFWQLLMSLSMARALDNVHSTVLEDPTQRSWLAVSLFLLAFLPTFVRHYFGDVRYLGRHYIERPRAKIGPRVDITERRFWIDVSLLFFHGILFVLMARSLHQARLFFILFAALLLMDVVYLRWTREDGSARGETHLRDRLLSSGPAWWTVNNLVHFVIMVPLIAWSFGDSPSVGFLRGFPLPLTLLAVACVTNSVADLAVTHGWYFPNGRTAEPAEDE